MALTAPLTITSDIQKSATDALVILYEVDTTKYPGGQIYRFHDGVSLISTSIVWAGNTYTPFPIEVSGFETSGNGSSPRPKVRIANISGLLGTLANSMSDLIGCKFTRIRTFAKYLDAVNFPGGINTTADPNAHFPTDIYFIDRKSTENKLIVEFELTSVLDLQGIMLPRRQVIANVCSWKYKGPECGFSGGAIANELDQLCASNGGSIPDIQDKCSKKLGGCELRFPNNQILPFGGFPAVGLIK